MKTKKEFKELRAKLLQIDVTQASIAKKFYTSRQAVGLALRGRSKSKLSQDINKYVEELLE